MLVTGEGGIGKTRLVAELARPATAIRCPLRPLRRGGALPVRPWIDMLRPRLAALSEPDLAALVTGAPEVARLLPEIRERLPELARLPAAGDADTQRRQLFGAVVLVVRRLAARGPVLLIVDDLHWADRSSLLLARHLAREPRPRARS